jgi:hypothetical protein
LFVVKQRYKNLPFYIFSISLDDFNFFLIVIAVFACNLERLGDFLCSSDRFF